MALIRGQFKAGPFVRAWIDLPVLRSERQEVDFLLDTGAQLSVLHPRDIALLLGVDLLVGGHARAVTALSEAMRIAFPNTSTRPAFGIGGSAEYVETEARLGFRDDDGRLQTYRLTTMLATPAPGNLGYPSFLGMDFLTYFDMHFNHSKDVVTLDYIED